MKIWLLLYSAIASASTTMSWDDCVKMTTKSNAELQSSEAALASTKESEGSALSGFFPQISASAGYSKSDASTISVDHDGIYTATISGSENLFNGMQDAGRWSQAKANTRAALSGLQILKARLSYDLKSAAEGVFYAAEYSKLTDEIIRRREENLRLVQLRFNSGRENKGSVLLSEAYLNQSKYDNLQAHNALNVAQAQLARSLGMEPGEKIELRDEIPIHEPRAPDFSKAALATPDYIQAVAQYDAADSAVTVARSGFLPTLALSGSMGNQGKTFYPDDRDKWSVGVNLTLPIFNGGKDYHATRAAMDTRSSADFARMNISRQVRTKLEQSYAGFIEAVAKLKVDDSFRQAALVRSEIARKKYNNGLLTFEDWDIIENDLITRQKSYLQSLRDRVIAEASWEQALGQGVIQ